MTALLRLWLASQEKRSTVGAVTVYSRLAWIGHRFSKNQCYSLPEEAAKMANIFHRFSKKSMLFATRGSGENGQQKEV